MKSEDYIKIANEKIRILLKSNLFERIALHNDLTFNIRHEEHPYIYLHIDYVDEREKGFYFFKTYKELLKILDELSS